MHWVVSLDWFNVNHPDVRNLARDLSKTVRKLRIFILLHPLRENYRVTCSPRGYFRPMSISAQNPRCKKDVNAQILLSVHFQSKSEGDTTLGSALYRVSTDFSFQFKSKLSINWAFSSYSTHCEKITASHVRHADISAQWAKEGCKCSNFAICAFSPKIRV